MRFFHLIIRGAAAAILSFASSAVLADGARITPLMQQDLADNKEGVMLTVEYGPGMSSKKHRHDADIFVYVLEGSITLQVAGDDPVTLVAGDTFYESPKDIHLVSKNASNTKSAKFLVVSLKTKGLPVVIPVP